MKILDWLRGKMGKDGRGDADARTLCRLACEVRDLARAVLVLGACDDELAERVRRMQEEMDELAKLASGPRFGRLPLSRRIALREGLDRSRKRLMQTMQAAPAPTQRLQ